MDQPAAASVDDCEIELLSSDSQSVWLDIVGGKPLLRAAMEQALSELHPPGTRPIREFARRLSASLSIVFWAHPDASEVVTERASQPDHYVLVVLDSLDRTQFANALSAGAHGVVTEDVEASYLCDVARCALQHDVLMPAEIARQLVAPDRADTHLHLEMGDSSLEVLQLLAAGLSLGKIASQLNFHPRTIQRRVSDICLRLGAGSPVEAVRLAIRHGLIT